MENFHQLNLPEALQHTLQNMKFEKPTPIQAQAIPLALEGRDILGSAQTGTGKTGAFGIPIIAKLITDPHSRALIMTPTRELAAQVATQMQLMLGKRSKIKSALLIGGDPMPKQLQQLRHRPRLIIGTPGRIHDHLRRKSLVLEDVDFLVLDETDRMLDMGFTIQIESILEFISDERQTMLFSATLPKNIMNIAKKYMQDPVRVSVDQDSSPAKNVQQNIIHVKEADKYNSFLQELENREGTIIIFMKTKYSTEKMATRLVKEGFEAAAIHGDLRQNKRDRVIANFRKMKFRILVATDVAARGLDIPHIEHVINYDLPQCAEDYIHRIGRTARAGAHGEAVSFVSPADKGKWRAIAILLDPSQKDKLPKDRFQKDKNKRSSGSRNKRRFSKDNQSKKGASAFHKNKKKGSRAKFSQKIGPKPSKRAA